MTTARAGPIFAVAGDRVVERVSLRQKQLAHKRGGELAGGRWTAAESTQCGAVVLLDGIHPVGEDEDVRIRRIAIKHRARHTGRCGGIETSAVRHLGKIAGGALVDFAVITSSN